MLNPIRILIADDHKVLRDGLRAIIACRKDMQVVAEAENGREALQKSQKDRPDIVIMDISMPGLNGIEATRLIIAGVPDAKVIALSMHSERLFVDRMLKAGVSGYLLKDCASEELIESIQMVRNGKVFLSPEITTKLVMNYLDRPSENCLPTSPCLSSREREVLQLIAEGQTTKEISNHLCVSIKTVESHRKRIMEKLNLFSVAELTKYALREGLTTLDS